MEKTKEETTDYEHLERFLYLARKMEQEEQYEYELFVLDLCQKVLTSIKKERREFYVRTKSN